jgi:hypothetical protein
MIDSWVPSSHFQNNLSKKAEVILIVGLGKIITGKIYILYFYGLKC